MSAILSLPPILSFTDMATSISEIQQAHAQMVKAGHFHHPVAASRLLTALTTKVGISYSFSYAHSVFRHIHPSNSYIYNMMIRAHATGTNPNLSFIIFLELLCHNHLFPDKFSFTFILKACATLCCVREGQQVHCLVIKSGLGGDPYVYNTLIHMYAKCGYFELARDLLNRQPNKDAISWNAMLSVLTEMGLMELACRLFNEMPLKNVESWNFMISGFVNCGLVDEARNIFDEMVEKDVVSWNAMITGYAKSARFTELLMLFREMQKSKVKPDNCTLVNALSACAGVGALHQGKWIHAFIERNRIEVTGFLATALVDMYSKCGSLEKALEVFGRTLRKDVSTWNSIISGLSIHGYGEQALDIFHEMVSCGFKPNEVTFVCILSACSRAGLLSQGRKMFEQMVHTYGIRPTIEHYGCMVDLFGRFGLLQEAEEIVRKLPMQESRAILESLLGACRNHANLEMAERLACKLFELDPKDGANYVQLSNIHASMGRWDEVKELRRKMRAKGIMKEPGCSLIEVDGLVYEFLAGEGMSL